MDLLTYRGVTRNGGSRLGATDKETPAALAERLFKLGFRSLVIERAGIQVGGITTGGGKRKPRIWWERIQEMTDPDERRVSAEKRIGANLRTLRERAGMSQTAVAAAMTEQGHSWHQSTVGRVETATQSLRLREAVDLAAILRIPLSALSELPTGGDRSCRSLDAP